MAKTKNKLATIGTVTEKLGSISSKGTVASQLQNLTSSILPGKTFDSIFTNDDVIVPTLNQYGPTDYINTNASTTTTTTASSSVDIYMNYSEAIQTAGEMSEVATIINESCSKLSSLLTDANTYWKSSAATLFTSKVEEYMTQMKKYKDFLDKKADTLRDSSKSYMDFDAAFAQTRIE